MIEESKNKESLDLLGIKPISDAILKVTDATVDGARAFLGRICLPAAEEFGLLLKDQVRSWRSQNLLRILAKSEQNVSSRPGNDSEVVHPRIANVILNEASWIDDAYVQDMWAGLLSSSCSNNKSDESNLIFTGLLSSITSLQAKVFSHACVNCRKSVTPNGLVVADSFIPLQVSIDVIQEITECSDIHRIDRELDHLTNLGLFYPNSGFHAGSSSLDASLTPSALGLQLYVRCCGSRQSVVEFFGLITEPESSVQSDGVNR